MKQILITLLSVVKKCGGKKPPKKVQFEYSVPLL